jgi:hypothetical protein
MSTSVSDKYYWSHSGKFWGCSRGHSGGSTNLSISASDKYCWPIAGGIGGIAVEVAVVGQSSPLVPQTTALYYYYIT